MNFPSFTAELSLYKSTAHYLPLRSTALHTNGAIKPMMISEEIEVFGCRPGLLQFGEGMNMTCVNPNDIFGTGGHGGGSPVVPLDDRGPRGPGSGSGETRPPKQPKTKLQCKTECHKVKRFDREWAVACDDFCDCLWDTANSAKECASRFKETTKEDPPPFDKPPKR